MSNQVLSFDAVILKADDMDAAYVEVPYDIHALFGKKRLKVHASFDGEPYAGLVLKMGTPCWIIGIRKDIRKKINKQPGDTVRVTLAARE
ncbi:MAG: DUF1905 domain-containing protein [Solobacterium sp.]|nr:DUF1905 domain-containing protein [Solobacterium sp.]